MSETATVALVAAAALLLWQATDTTSERRRLALLGMAGLVAGLALLVRLSSVVLVAALVAALIGWFSHGRSDEGLEPDVEPYGGHHRQGHGYAAEAGQ